MRVLAFFIVSFFLLSPCWAIDAPSSQIHIKGNEVLRGRFLQEHQMNTTGEPVTSSGHFTLAPTIGLIWGMEKPFPTSTIVTENAAAQMIGGLVMKLPAKNIRHLYDMVGSALAGDWSKLGDDFDITPSGDAKHWQMILTPLQNQKSPLSYKTITVTGNRYVESIVMLKADGSFDAFHFSDPILSAPPLTNEEAMAFNQIKP